MCGVVSEMRTHRPCQVQTLEQYKWIYLALSSLLSLSSQSSFPSPKPSAPASASASLSGSPKDSPKKEKQ